MQTAAETTEQPKPQRAFDHPAFSLNVIQVASPCSADWDAMSGDDRRRLCGQCNKSVYNLSAMSEAAALQLIREKEGHLCVQFYRRADGSVLTQDCAVGVRAQLRAAWVKTVARVAAAGVFGLSLFGLGCKARGSATTTGAPDNSAIGLQAPRVVAPPMPTWTKGEMYIAPPPPPKPTTGTAPVVPVCASPSTAQ